MRAGDDSAWEQTLRQSLDLAEQQSALSWQLRTAVCLLRLSSRHGDGIEARERLANVYSRFAEGFDTADLRVAQAVLNETNPLRNSEAPKRQVSCPRGASSSEIEL